MTRPQIARVLHYERVDWFEGVALAMTVAGSAAVMFAATGAFGNNIVALQLPYLMSGGVGGVALMVTGTSLIAIQRRRRAAARRTGAILDLVTHAVELAQVSLRIEGDETP